METIPTAFVEELRLEDISFSEEQMRERYGSAYNRIVKRIIDFFMALVFIIVLSPVLLIVTLCIALETGFPVLYRPLRGGYKNKPFRICKFRTMVKDADKIGGGTTALNDSRITKIGAILRKTKLDEIVQLFNVLNGSMAFVGPRPELLKYTEAYDALEKNILMVRPGITDFSSITLINLDEIVGSQNADEMYEKYVLKKKNQLRLKYVLQVSFKTDCKLFFYTIYRVICKALKFIFRRKTDIAKKETKSVSATLQK